jgi:hypothetical protein
VAQQRIAILSAPGDIGWRNAAAKALGAYALTKVALTAQSVLDPGDPVLLIWTARAAAQDTVARALLAGRRDVVLWRPDGAAAPGWLSGGYPVGPDMPARALAIMVRIALSETGREALPAPRKPPHRLAPAAAAALCAAAIACAALAAQWVDRPVATAHAPPVVELRGRQ